MAEEFGGRLKAALKQRGWYQSDLVRETGLDKNTVASSGACRLYRVPDG